MEMEGLEKRLLMGTAWRLLIQRALVPGLVRFGQLPPVADALEIGAGGGFAAETLLSQFPGWRLTVTDYDEDMVELARAQLGRFSLRRTIQRMVEDPLSEKLLYKEFQAGQTIIVDARDGDIVFEAAAPPPDIPPVELAGRES